MLDQQINEALAALVPKLTETQCEIVNTVISDFEKLGGDTAKRIILRYLNTALENPKNIGFHPDITPCGCDNGFRIKEQHGSTLLVERCPICSDPDRFTDIPRSFLD